MKTLHYTILAASIVMIVSSCKKEASLTGSFTDSRDGTVYKTIKIGNQTWFAENLAYLPAVYRSPEGSSTEARYYVYGYQGNDVIEAKASGNYGKYGALYNFEAARAACPTGWHVPSDDEWIEMEVYLGMNPDEKYDTGGRGYDEAIGNKLKATSGWDWDEFHDADGNGNNQSGFNALPGGIRAYEGTFNVEGEWGEFWSTSPENPDTHYWNRYLVNDNWEIGRWGFYVTYGLSIRCVKD